MLKDLYAVRAKKDLDLCCPQCSWCQDLSENKFLSKSEDNYIPAIKEPVAAMRKYDCKM